MLMSRSTEGLINEAVRYKQIRSRYNSSTPKFYEYIRSPAFYIMASAYCKAKDCKVLRRTTSYLQLRSINRARTLYSIILFSICFEWVVRQKNLGYIELFMSACRFKWSQLVHSLLLQ